LARLSLTSKVLSVYLAVAIFFALASGYALYSCRCFQAQLERESLTTLEILQSLHEVRADLLRDDSDLSLVGGDAGVTPQVLSARSTAIASTLRRIAAVAGDDPSIRALSTDVNRYLQTFGDDGDRQPDSSAEAGSSAKTGLQTLLSSLATVQAEQRNELQSRLRALDVAAGKAHEIVLFLTVLGMGVGLVTALLIARRLKGSLGKLGSATQMIADGAFDYDSGVESNDEIGELAVGLKNMAQKLKNYEQLCLDASPLTRLPGNIAIERALLERIRRSENFALCYADLDDFKAYNDNYGYAKGSEIIKVTGELLHNVKDRHGGEDDFVGHIGGDDFVLITAPANASVICESIIREFDQVIPFFYSEEDRRRGYIKGTDRFGVTRQFPLMTISIAVVSDVSRDILSPTEIAQVAAEIKEYVKALPGSNYLVDRRRSLRKSAPDRADA